MRDWVCRDWGSGCVKEGKGKCWFFVFLVVKGS